MFCPRATIKFGRAALQIAKAQGYTGFDQSWRNGADTFRQAEQSICRIR